MYGSVSDAYRNGQDRSLLTKSVKALKVPGFAQRVSSGETGETQKIEVAWRRI